MAESIPTRHHAGAVAVASLRGLIARSLEWVFRGRAIAAARLELDALPSGALERLGSAERAFELGDAARSSCLTNGGDEARLAAELFRKSRDWANGSAEPSAAAQDSTAAKTAPSDWVDLDALRRAAASSLAQASEVRDRVDQLAFSRALRLLVLGLIMFAVAGVIALRNQLFPGKDLAANAQFRTSSQEHVCDGVSSSCGPGVFFHTSEEDAPWFEFDFGEPTRFSALTVENRVDCCLTRATPLVVELSDDGTHYRELVRRTEPFATWRPQFSTQSARFLRVRVTRRSILHLRALKVHP